MLNLPRNNTALIPVSYIFIKLILPLQTQEEKALSAFFQLQHLKLKTVIYEGPALSWFHFSERRTKISISMFWWTIRRGETSSFYRIAELSVSV